MTKCDGCGKEVGKLYCAKCRAKIERKTQRKRFGKLIPLLWYDKEHRCYYAGCTVIGCPCNAGGICTTAHLTIESIKAVLHEFDGDNIIQQVCG